jgi:hypothetical protein
MFTMAVGLTLCIYGSVPSYGSDFGLLISLAGTVNSFSHPLAHHLELRPLNPAV